MPTDIMMREGDWGAKNVSAKNIHKHRTHKARVGQRAKGMRGLMWVRRTVRAMECGPNRTKAELV